MKHYVSENVEEIERVSHRPFMAVNRLYKKRK